MKRERKRKRKRQRRAERQCESSKEGPLQWWASESHDTTKAGIICQCGPSTVKHGPRTKVETAHDSVNEKSTSKVEKERERERERVAIAAATLQTHATQSLTL